MLFHSNSSLYNWHRPFVGGDLWLNFWKEKKDYLTADEIIKMIEDLNKLTGNNFFVLNLYFIIEFCSKET